MQENQKQPSNLGIITSRNEFTNIPIEYTVPKNAQIIYVADFFKHEVAGGAELTGEAIMESSPYRVFYAHASSVTDKFIKNNKDKYFIFGNYTLCPAEFVNSLLENKVKYSVIEFDYKYCLFRSEVLHRQKTGKECDCCNNLMGMVVEAFYTNADVVFWMSSKQRDKFISKIPSLATCNHVVQSSTFDKETINLILTLKEEKLKRKKMPIKIYGIQGSANWIKGTNETIAYCNANKFAFKIIQNMGYQEFLKELSKCDVFVFHPLDLDTCPRVVEEAKLLGLDLDLNENVQIRDEEWLKTPESLLEHLNSRVEYFWDNIKL